MTTENSNTVLSRVGISPKYLETWRQRNVKMWNISKWNININKIQDKIIRKNDNLTLKMSTLWIRTLKWLKLHSNFPPSSWLGNVWCAKAIAVGSYVMTKPISATLVKDVVGCKYVDNVLFSSFWSKSWVPTTCFKS